MKRFALLFSMFFMLVLGGKAQISVTSADVMKYYEAGKYQINHAADSVVVNVGTASSAAQNFTILFEPTQTVTFTNYQLWDNLEPFSRFPGATHASGFSYALPVTPETTFTTTVYSFIKITDDSLIGFGSALRQQWTPPVSYLPADTTYFDFETELLSTLPIVYGTAKAEAETTYDFISSGLYTITRHSESVDGFGSLTVPQGTFDVLRVTDKIVEEHYAAPATEPYDVDSSVTVSFIGNGGIRVGIDIVPGHPSAGTTLAENISVSVLSSTPAGVKSEQPAAVNGFRLDQNFPNPFNPATTVSFSLSRSGPTTVKVFDILGKDVTTLINEHLQAGLYTVPFNAADLPSGVYFYSLQSGNFRETKKMMLIK